jgi:ATP-binding cassette subfamily C protein PrsD
MSERPVMNARQEGGNGGSGVEIFARCRAGLVTVGVASALINILYLTSSFFMLQVYDRVIPSRSVPTLVALSLLALFLYLFQGAFELARSRMLTRISGIFDEQLGERVFKTAVKMPVKGNGATDGLALMRDFDQIRSFLASAGPPAFFDLPWLPFYIVICFLFHPLIGIIAIGGAAILMILTFLTNRATQAVSKRVYEAGGRRSALLEAAHRNAEVVEAMGMADDLSRNWSGINERYRRSHQKNADIANGYGTISKIFRIALQSAVLATGAVLVIENQASAGIIIAASILTSRALAPVEQAIANWRGFVSAQQSWRRLRQILDALMDAPPPLQLAAPERSLVVDNLASGPPGRREIIISTVGFSVEAGDAIGVIGPSASGKSSLARALTGIWPTHRGSVRLDGATIEQWSDHDRGRHIGYLPQDIELFSGTVAENISRFRADPEARQIVEAAMAAGVHELILALPNGYSTEVGPSGSMLSAGQRQRIALARALFGNPFLVILDEPNSNLDADGEGALGRAIVSIRNRGGIAIIIAHRPSALAGVNFVLMMSEGRVSSFGPRDEILAKVLRRDMPSGDHRPTPLKIVSEAQE